MKPVFRRENSASITLFVCWSVGLLVPTMKFLLTSKSGYVEIASPQGPRACFGSLLFFKESISNCLYTFIIENIYRSVIQADQAWSVKGLGDTFKIVYINLYPISTYPDTDDTTYPIQAIHKQRGVAYSVSH
jgi:hypothetical protein